VDLVILAQIADEDAVEGSAKKILAPCSVEKRLG
jgi:hypothetical protein